MHYTTKTSTKLKIVGRRSMGEDTGSVLCLYLIVSGEILD
jgi:hypothetical protein